MRPSTLCRVLWGSTTSDCLHLAMVVVAWCCGRGFARCNQTSCHYGLATHPSSKRQTVVCSLDMERAIAYLRVSTQRQHRSGLGIEAQRSAIDRFAASESIKIAAEYVEAETGKGADAL